jgi:hypothetical protein
MSYNMMLCYDIYDCFTMEHFQLRQRMTLATKIYCSRLYVLHDFIMYSNDEKTDMIFIVGECRKNAVRPGHV